MKGTMNTKAALVSVTVCKLISNQILKKRSVSINQAALITNRTCPNESAVMGTSFEVSDC